MYTLPISARKLFLLFVGGSLFSFHGCYCQCYTFPLVLCKHPHMGFIRKAKLIRHSSRYLGKYTRKDAKKESERQVRSLVGREKWPMTMCCKGMHYMTAPRFPPPFHCWTCLWSNNFNKTRIHIYHRATRIAANSTYTSSGSAVVPVGGEGNSSVESGWLQHRYT